MAAELPKRLTENGVPGARRSTRRGSDVSAHLCAHEEPGKIVVSLINLALPHAAASRLERPSAPSDHVSSVVGDYFRFDAE